MAGDTGRVVWNMNYEEREIKKAFDVVNPDLVEVRIIGSGFTASGYFRTADTLLKALSRYKNKQGVNFYMVMNDIDHACYSRTQSERFIERPKETTSDKDITGRKWFLIDLDADRPSGVSTTNEELKSSIQKGGEIYTFMQSLGFEKPVVALSGNGMHLLYRIALVNSDQATAIIKRCLQALDMLYSDEVVKVDTSVYNASRITKLYGTYARKGNSTEERPHRVSRIVEVPSEIKPTDVSILMKLAAKLPEPEKPKGNPYSGNYQQFDLDTWIQQHGIKIKKESQYQGGTKYTLEECPFNPEHKESAIFKLQNGAIGFSCFHSSCQQYGWKEFRQHFEPDAYTQRTTPRVNSQSPSYQKKVQAEEPYKDEPDFWTAGNVEEEDRSQIVSIKTGIRELDMEMAGLNKGDVTCLSGVNSSGKSTILSQIALETINQGYKVALFSGELKASRAFSWIKLLAAGKLYVEPTDIPKFFRVNDGANKYIKQWLNDKLYLYNNHKGKSVDKILDRVMDCVKKNKVDMIILDNLMAMDLSLISGDKYEKQSAFIQRIKELAEEYDVHIVLVAHPRKADGFLRKNDISGTADLTNASDNVIIVHRVNNDFKRLSAQMFGWHEDYHLYGFDNVVEICKNRDLGVQDLFVGMFFELESKRFLNERSELKHYKWEDMYESSAEYKSQYYRRENRDASYGNRPGYNPFGFRTT